MADKKEAAFKLSRLLSNQEKERDEVSKKRPHNRILGSSSSSSIGPGAQIFSEESMGLDYRHDVEEDAQMSDSRGATSTEDTIMTDGAPPQHHVHADRDSFPRQTFKFASEECDGSKKKANSSNPSYQRTERTKLNTMELSDYYDKTVYPRRVCIAENYRFNFKTIINPITGKQEVQRKDAKGKDYPETLYKYHIYPRPSAFLIKVAMQSDETRYAFIIVEEGEPIFAYFDFDLGPEHRKLELHGDSHINLLGYSMAMIRMLISQVLCVNVLCMGDGYALYETEKKEKWSDHVHVAWPFEERISLHDVMAKVSSRLSEVHADGVKAVAPMFFTRYDKNAKKEVETCVVDMTVYTKKRNFRVPYAKKAKEGSSILKPTTSVKLWNKPQDTEMCASNALYEGLSTCMVLCRNSFEFWNSHTVRKKEVLPAKGDVALFSQDFQCLPVTGKVQTYKQVLSELASQDNCRLDQDKRPAAIVWGGKNTSLPVDTRIEKYLEKFFRLLYDESWPDAVRLAQSRGADYQRVLTDIYKICRKSPLHTQAVLVLLPQVYKTGMDLLQVFPRSSELTFDKVVEYARLIGDVFSRSGPCSEAFEHLWEFRTMVEMAYSNTCTPAQRTKRAEYLDKLGSMALPVFTEEYALNGGSYNASGCATDIVFIDMFITEVMLWSGQAVHVFEMDPATGGDNTAKLLDVLPKDRSDYDDLFRRCIYYTCRRLGRQVDVPSRTTRARGPVTHRRPELPPMYEEMKRRAAARGFAGPIFPFMTLKK
jgi:hypothetical protein